MTGNIETENEMLDNTEAMPDIEEHQEQQNTASSPSREDHLRAALNGRFSKLENIKTEIPTKTYLLVLEKLKNEEAELNALFQKEKAQKAEREKVTQALPKAYFEQRYLRIKEIRID